MVFMETLTLLRFWKQQCSFQWSWLTTVLSCHSHWINLRSTERHLYQNRKAEFVRHFRKQKSSLTVGPSPPAAACAGVRLHTEQMAQLKPKPIIISQARLQQVMVCRAEWRALWQVISTPCPITSAASGVSSQQFCSWDSKLTEAIFSASVIISISVISVQHAS